MAHLHGHSITYRIAMGPRTGRKVFTLQTLPACDPDDPDTAGKSAGFSLHAGVAAKATGQPDAIPRGVRTQQRPPLTGDAGKAGQGQQAQSTQ